MRRTRPWRPRWAIAGAIALVAFSAACTGPRSSTPATSTTERSTATSGPTAPSSTSSPPTTECSTPVRSWPASRLAAQLLMVSGQYSDLQASEPEAAAGAGGFVLFGQPPSGSATTIRAGLSALTSSAASAGQVTPWMSTDTEGGTVSRLADVLGPLPSARQMAAEWSPSQVQAAASTRGDALRALGMTMDLAPVLDTASPTDQVADEDQRSFSATPQIAATYGTAFASGLRSAGVVAVAKHFPGLGHANADTDTGPATDPPLSELEADDLIPFTRAVAAGIPVVMVGHPVVPGLTTGRPASLASATYRLLRRTLHFTGVALTDSLSAGAIADAGYDQAAAAVAAIEAGADMAMVQASTWQPTLAALEHALSDGALPASQADASARRILSAKGVPTCGT